MSRGHRERKCGMNRSSSWLDQFQDTAQPAPLCLTLSVFDLQQGDPAAGTSKNTSPCRAHLQYTTLCYLCVFPHITVWSVLSGPISCCIKDALLPKILSLKTPGGILSLQGAGGPNRGAHFNLRKPARPVLQSAAGSNTGACLCAHVYAHT